MHALNNTINIDANNRKYNIIYNVQQCSRYKTTTIFIDICLNALLTHILTTTSKYLTDLSMCKAQPQR